MNDRDIIRSYETGLGKRLALLALAFVVIAILVGVVIAGFRGKHVSRSADALTTPEVSPSTHSPAKAPRPPAPVPSL